ncbi:hypothetical protein B566_EDAN001169 [Ephemera danica]|nr:hypothetical protein B566_EDAN001169 [Ephemera danica]
MPKNKMITKGCPQCDLQVPVACKACPCGHSFFSARRTIRPVEKLTPTNDVEMTRRRTERVKREKPNYYDALEYDNQKKKKTTPRQQKSGASSTDERDDGREFLDMDDDDEADQKNSARKRRLRRKLTTEREEEEEDPMANLPPEKTLQYSIELAEINRKIISSSWKPQQ